MEPRVIGVVGAGRMGLALARLLGPAGFEFVFHDASREALERAAGEGYRVAGSLRGLMAESDAVMVAVGYREVTGVLRSLRRLLESNAAYRASLVFDIATFKEGLMEEYERFPQSVLVASAHPLFGPGARDPSSHPVAVVPVPGRGEGARAVARIFRRAGFRVYELGLEEHEELVASTVGLAYALASALPKALGGMWPLTREISGTTFRLLRILAGAVAADREDFIAYILSNPRVAVAVERLSEALASAVRDPQGSAATLKEAAESESGKHYTAMYKCIEKAG